MIKPPALKSGDTIGVVAPAGAVIPNELDAGIKRLQALGFRVKLGKSLKESFHGMAGSDPVRASDLLTMFQDPEVRAILCARGGYGSARIIPYLDQNLIRMHPKVFVGCSDITALLVYLTQTCELVAFHGPMVGPHFGKFSSPLTETFFLNILTGDYPMGPVSLPGVKVLRQGQAEGRLVGGCLSLICAGLGTPYELKTDHGILFLEDIHEPPYRIDRMLTQIKHAGKLDKVCGILFGRMPECQPVPQSGYRLEDVVLDVLKDFEGPVLWGIPSGHSEESITLPLGVRIKVKTPGKSEADSHQEGFLRFEERAVSVTPSGGVPGGAF